MLGGGVFLSSQGKTTIAAQGCTGPLCPVVRAQNEFFASADGDFALVGPARVEAENALEVQSRGDVTGDAGSGYRAPNLFITAENDVTIRNASGGRLRAQAGAVLGEGTFFVDGTLTLGEANGSGVFNLDGSLFGSAGSTIGVTAGTAIDTGNTITLISGNDIVIGARARLQNNTGGARPGSILLDAGGLATDATFLAGNVASLLIGNGAIIDGTGGSVTLAGGAIDARNAIVAGTDIKADVRNPPAAGVAQLNDNGQLTAPCLQGDICLGRFQLPARSGSAKAIPRRSASTERVRSSA